VFHETIYRSIYVQPKARLRTELAPLPAYRSGPAQNPTPRQRRDPGGDALGHGHDLGTSR